MKVRGYRKPEAFCCTRSEDEMLITFAENVREITNAVSEEDAEPGTEYEYDRYQLTVPYRDNLESDIEADLPKWVAMAKQQEYDKKAAEVRAKRNALLEETDSAFCIDRILPENISTTAFTNKLKELAQSDTAKYRQALRDIPEQEGFPFKVKWPAKPQ